MRKSGEVWGNSTAAKEIPEGRLDAYLANLKNQPE